MQPPHRNPSKRIPKSIGTDAKLFGRFTLMDVIVALVPGVAVILVVQTVVPPDLAVFGYSIQVFGLPLALVAIAIGGLFVSLTPSYTTSLDWLTAFVGFRLTSNTAEHREASEQTLVERLHPDHDAVERIDGALVGFVRVEPPSMALATDTQWSATADAFTDFLNTTVEFPIQIYSTTQPFPVANHLAHYETRLSDPDVRANPRLQALIEHYVEWYGEELERRRMTIRDHYVIVSVEPSDVRYESESLAARVSRVPIVGRVIGFWARPSRALAREAMFEELDSRCDRVARGLRDIEGCRARRIPLGEALPIVRRFWTGHADDLDATAQIRSTALLGGQS
ncbi:hypothetical protein [Halapricum hydrolyticum]|uniref:PrgI family protein n=1 Tax=Halapricum hydrolyticum TaxID=2979991 RepID=A0AAE3LEH6_9EURY|nr:hypothetical protein [Halapricum hydrolyticum]MCU4726392.1 hypothetical protein [Halapricum hydrolyticum]